MTTTATPRTTGSRIARSWNAQSWIGFVALGASLALAGCGQEQEAQAPQLRPVRVVTVEKGEGGQLVSFTGEVLAQDEASLAFRVSGRMIERSANVGDQVKAGQIVARLDPQNALNSLRSAQAAVTAAESQLVTAANTFDRQERLLVNGFTTQANHDAARTALQAAQSALDNAEAQLKIATDNVSYTDLVADAPGTVTARGAEPGEVVQAGQMILQLARQGGRDAVFDVPANILRSAPADPVIRVTLSDDPSVTATGRVREVAPQADPVTRTFRVRVGLDTPPAAMRLGSTVVGQVRLENDPVIDIPASALTAVNSQPAVWVVDPATQTVALRNIQVRSFSQARVAVESGLTPGEVVVTAGVQALHPGQKVRLLGAGS
ncbi:efflux RND transporter periplasmic adaptor subunit [Ancylobacter sp. TS-1]|uniref:efflux RND transporter periplasmic adaptor subunit n=1 Tax=Ancylobacter sp. TS-1 TaxID=1850374 RepID=UPI001265B50C|nr:efflux RND transporter periplasmic adaptor subunit [Ancylobacter sp. TS-1]QFR33040.1 efflux RND transporter periplasmic adaptor subunit [Ancylobacter sp. TS-1]